MTSRAPLWLGLGFVAAGLVILVIAAAAGTAGPFGPGVRNPGGQGPMMGGRPGGATLPAPGSSGFVAGTVSSPRVVQIVATAQLRFVPDAVAVKQGETVTLVANGRALVQVMSRRMPPAMRVSPA